TSADRSRRFEFRRGEVAGRLRAYSAHRARSVSSWIYPAGRGDQALPLAGALPYVITHRVLAAPRPPTLLLAAVRAHRVLLTVLNTRLPGVPSGHTSDRLHAFRFYSLSRRSSSARTQPQGIADVGCPPSRGRASLTRDTRAERESRFPS